MINKKFKNNWIIGSFWIGIILMITMVPLLERKIFQDKSWFKSVYNNVIMGPFNYYGYGIVPCYVFKFNIDWKYLIEEKEKKVYSELKTAIKKEMKIHGIDMTIEDGVFVISTNKDLKKFLNKENYIEWQLENKNTYKIIINKKTKDQWKNHIFSSIKKFLINKYSKKSCQVNFINESQLELKVFSENNLNKIDVSDGPLNGYGMVEYNNQISDNKKMMIGDNQPFPVYKYILFNRTMIENYEWMDHEKQYLLKLKLNQEALNNIEYLKQFNMNKILLKSNAIHLNQKEFGGFKPILTDDWLIWGLLNIQKGGGINNFIIQVLFDDNSKIILTNYLNLGSYEGKLELFDNVIIEYPQIKKNILWIMIMAIIALILLWAIAMIVLYKKKGMVSVMDVFTGILFSGFLIRLFDLIFDIRLIILFVMLIISFILVNIWRQFNINNNKLQGNGDINFMIKKQIYHRINKITNLYSIGIMILMGTLYFLAEPFRQGIIVILIGSITLLINNNLLWNNWILYYSTQNQ